MSETNRLGGTLPPEFAHPVIDRTRPVRFRLNGRAFSGFEGDTVLSALLASGVHAAGRLGTDTIALDAHTAPPIALESNDGRADLAMPMAICPAADGVSFVSVGPSPAVGLALAARLVPRPSDTLGLIYTTGSAEPGGWIDTKATRRITADVAIVGGGVAGLSAALAAARKGLRVCLVEKEATLGGMSEFFGKAEGEPAPDETIATLASQIGESGLITLLLGTLAFDLSGNSIEAIRVLKTGALPQPERIAVKATTIVLATGMIGRMPIFAGNRLPGVIEASAAWRLAARYNIWPGASAHIHSTTNAGYRMALLGAASGKTIARASDPRIDPQTRFIEFCKAYGYRLGWGMTVGSATPTRRAGLAIRLADVETGAIGEEAISCDRLIVSGGWQPDLDLWLKASGPVQWDGQHQTLVARGKLEGVVLAGSVAGYLSLGACVEHGKAALEAGLDGQMRSVPDPRIDPIFDTPDGPLLLSPSVERQPSAFTAPGTARTLDAPAPRGWARLIDRSPKPTAASLTEPLGPLDIVGEIVASRLDPAFVPSLCAERCVLPRALAATGDTAPLSGHVPEDIPLYLQGRFGPHQEQWTLVPGGPRRFEPGCLVFANTDHRSPLDAVGVVLAGQGGEIRALLGHRSMNSGDIVYIRDGLTTLAARLERPV